MRARPLLRVAGPLGSGKTTFVEAVLRSRMALSVCVRCRCDPRRQVARESAPVRDAELRRYRSAGAVAAALYSYPRADSDAFYESEVVKDYSEAIVIEGDSPAGFEDLLVFVAPPLPAGTPLFRRFAGSLMARPPGSTLDELLAPGALGLPRNDAALLERWRRQALGSGHGSRGTDSARTVERNALAEAYEGLERAQLVVVNVRADDDRTAAEAFVADVHRLRRDDVLARDILGPLGSRTAVTAVVSDLVAPRDPGRTKALARVRRAIRAAG